MIRNFVYVGILSLSLVATLVTADEVQDAQPDAAAFGERILAITDVVLQNHIDPPTRQEMILDGIKALYRADNRQVPNGLSGRVSGLAEAAEFADFLKSMRSEFGTLKDAETILANGLLEAVPGYPQLIVPTEDRIQEQIAANRYVGIGIVLALAKNRRPQVPKVLHDGPAWKAGMKNGDIILEIDSQSTESKELNVILQELRGEEGSELTVVVQQPNSDEKRTLTMTRSRVFIPTIQGYREKSEGEWQYTVDASNDIAFIRINTIGPSTVQEIQQAQTRLQQDNIRGIILDLREGGGIMHNVVMVADALLDGGVIGHVRSLDSVETYKARPEAMFQDIPLVVLISKHSNADRVFLTAALQDLRGAIVVGEPTLGETFVNSFLPIPGRQERIKLAIGVMQRGDGTPLIGLERSQQQLPVVPATESSAAPQKRPGFIMPDHIVSGGGSPVDLGSDPVIAKAVEVLKATGAQAAARPNGDDKEGT
jgi:carboxyl-terminal processing protease